MAETESFELSISDTIKMNNQDKNDDDKQNKHITAMLSGFDEESNSQETRHSESEHSALSRIVDCRQCLKQAISRNRKSLAFGLKVLFFIGVCVYLGFAFKYTFGDEQSVTLLGIVCCVFVYLVISKLTGRYGESLKRYFTAQKGRSKLSKLWRRLYRYTVSVLIGVLVAYVVVDSGIRRPQNLVSILGIIVFTAFMLVFSKYPDKIRWRPVIGGLTLQFIFGLIVLRTSWGLASFQWLADQVTAYLDHTDHGSKFVFGKNFQDHYFAFKVMPCIIMFSATISVLYYLGVMQVAIRAITAVMRVTLDTGPMETLHAAFNIFVGWAETIPVVKPLLDEMTLAEIHAVMTNGFATVSGGTLVAYILYGAPANHLISASFMSAPAALAMGKLFYPEKSSVKIAKKAPKIEKTERGIIDAASQGAINAIPVIAYIIVHLIAFLSLLDFINDTLAWLGARVGLAPPDHPKLSFEYISSYLMWPVALLMGVEVADCRLVARMLGLKVFVNEFLAFQYLGVVRANNLVLQNYTSTFTNATWHWLPTDDIMLDGTGELLIGGAVSERSTTIATYALCGFSDLVALGLMVGAYSAVAPSRRQDFLRVAPRALISGVMACFLTAAMAGLMVH